MDELIGREVMGEVGPLTPGPGDPEGGIEHFSQGIFPHRVVFRGEEQVGTHEEVRFVIDIAGVGVT